MKLSIIILLLGLLACDTPATAQLIISSSLTKEEATAGDEDHVSQSANTPAAVNANAASSDEGFLGSASSTFSTTLTFNQLVATASEVLEIQPDPDSATADAISLYKLDFSVASDTAFELAYQVTDHDQFYIESTSTLFGPGLLYYSNATDSEGTYAGTFYSGNNYEIYFSGGVDANSSLGGPAVTESDSSQFTLSLVDSPEPSSVTLLLVMSCLVGSVLKASRLKLPC